MALWHAPIISLVAGEGVEVQLSMKETASRPASKCTYRDNVAREPKPMSFEGNQEMAYLAPILVFMAVIRRGVRSNLEAHLRYVLDLFLCDIRYRVGVCAELTRYPAISYTNSWTQQDTVLIRGIPRPLEAVIPEKP